MHGAKSEADGDAKKGARKAGEELARQTLESKQSLRPEATSSEY